MTSCCFQNVWNPVQNGTKEDPIKTLEILENILEQTKVEGAISMHFPDLVVLLFKPNRTSDNLEIFASDSEAGLTPVANRRVHVRLPREVGGRGNKIIFSMLKFAETASSMVGTFHEVYDQRLVGLSVQGKKISGLQERFNITMNFTTTINETQEPSCQFLNFTAKNFSKEGCLTLWTRGQGNVTCSCDHFTYFAVIMVCTSISLKDQKILSYITITGCSLSLCALVIAVLLFITNRKLREDISMKVHINLVIALILLNLHFLPSHMVAAESTTWLCFYMALALHYSLLAAFSWMALEGFHLYLLFVKVFDTYVSRYLLKVCVVGWGVPAVIVSLVVIIDREFYGYISISPETAVCFINNQMVKMVTTTGLFPFVFLFNMLMFAVTVKRVFSVGQKKKLGQIIHTKVIKSICRLLGVCALLGLTWGLAFFSFGQLTTPSLYLFCILNSLQGFFIFLWFVMSVRKSQNSAKQTSIETRSKSN
ncbi:adhesion G-protein coupled receptor G2-like [Astatotilapia calliptera]|uniref:adhesion G-protein coupled receptor G2-like n=1 Tax=Astatotilapia calliptera TaxID=8154 RepID=UPI000E40B4F5|nr:adhesion G-protein coupled receptor G2-like [Astatotilapia calliptera]